MVTKLASKLKIICRSANGFFDLVSVPKLSKTAVNRKGSMDCNEIAQYARNQININCLLCFLYWKFLTRMQRVRDAILTLDLTGQ